jgi:DNA-binding transcriptional ArsR family regulator
MDASWWRRGASTTVRSAAQVVDATRVERVLDAATVTPSAAVELYSLMSTTAPNLPTGGRRARLLAAEPELARELAGFWDDGGLEFNELLVLATHAERLGDEDPLPLIGELNLLVGDDLGDPGLETETVAERAVTVHRLERLAREPDLMKRYQALLRRAWAVLEPEWDRAGLAATRAACDEWRGQLANAAGPLATVEDLREALPTGHVGRWERNAPLIDRALSRGRLLLCPLFFADWLYLITALPEDTLVVGSRIPLTSWAGRARERAEPLARQLRVLADPTRLAILAHLAREPLTIGDLTAAFDVSQPAISNHIQKLRDAGFVEVLRDGGRTRYAVPRDLGEGVVRRLAADLLGYWFP